MANPLVTMAFPCYQQQQYVEQALQSVLNQTYSPLQIVVSDDGSSDGTYEIVRDLCDNYRGPHSIEVNRNDAPSGIENYNKFMELAKGEFIVVAHSDDISSPDRVEQIVAAWQEHEVSLVSSNAIKIDEEGNVQDTYADKNTKFDMSLDGLASKGWNKGLLGATLSWEREVFDRFGPLNRLRSAVSTDWILPFRAALLRGIHYIHEPLLQFRVHSASRAERFLKQRDSEESAREESVLANKIAQLVYMLETLHYFQKSAAEHERPGPEISDSLIRHILKTSVSWSELRNGLMANGKRNRWIKA